MVHDQDTGSIIQGLTKPRGALLAAPVILGLALVLSVVAGGEPSVARDANGSDGVSAHVGTPVQRAPKLLSNERSVDQAAPIRLAEAAKIPNGLTAGSFSAAQEKEIGAIVRRYLLANPEVLVEVSTELEKRRKAEQEGSQAKTLEQEKTAIFRSPHDFVLGNPKGDVTVVEYFDYNCGWCKRAYNEVTKLTASDKNVRVVMKEFPIFGEDSAFAARAALASIKQNKYWQFHSALMKTQKVTAANTFDIAKRVGIDVAALKKEMENPIYAKVLEDNARIAQGLGMQGTPGFIVDSRVNYGYLPVSGIQKLLAEVRKDGCKIC